MFSWPVVLVGQYVRRMPIDDVATRSVDYADVPRPWEDMWLVVNYALEALERRYASTEVPLSEEGLRNDVLIFFLTCHHLVDHLWNIGPGGLTRDAVYRAINNTTDLKLATDFSNSFKHHTRHQGERQVRIAGNDSDPVSLRLAWEDNGGVEQQRDALDLARGAMADWRQILRDAGLTH